MEIINKRKFISYEESALINDIRTWCLRVYYFGGSFGGGGGGAIWFYNLLICIAILNTRTKYS